MITTKLVDLIRLSLAPIRMQVLDYGPERHCPAVTMLRGSHDLVIDEPMVIALVSNRARLPPARTRSLDIVTPDQQVRCMVTNEDTRIPKIVGTNDMHVISNY